VGKPVAGEVVVIPLPQTDLRAGKRRPALVLVDLPGNDLILCQITSRARSGETSVTLVDADFQSGESIREELIAPLGLTVTDAARVLCISRPTLSTLLNEKSDVSADMALRIEKAFGFKMDTLLRMQNAYDIFRARKRAGKIKVRRYSPKKREALATI
jgi:addiction module HigA family antidote